MNEHYRAIVEAAGAVFLRIQNNSVIFCALPGSPPLTLYCFACDREGVRLALKSQREQMLVDHWEQLI
jgi:hypothetical protein